MKKGSEVMVPASEESLAQLRQDYPTEVAFNRVLLPRFGLVSQDVTEEVRDPKTKKKSLKIVAEAGTLYLERQGDEEEEVEGADGKMVMRKLWVRDELGEDTEGIILYQRKQLKYYDEAKGEFTSSPVYDNDDEEIPLFLNKKEIKRGTPAELKKLYPGKTATGKPKSNLEDNRILYVLIGDEVFQLNLRGSSMYSFLTYARKTLPPSVLTKFSSEPQEKGSNKWNMMTFEAVRPLSQEEVDNVLEKVGEIKAGIETEKSYYAAAQKADGESDEDAKERREANKRF